MQPFSSQAEDSGKLVEFIKRGVRDEMPAPLVPKSPGSPISIVERIEQNGHRVRGMPKGPGPRRIAKSVRSGSEVSPLRSQRRCLREEGRGWTDRASASSNLSSFYCPSHPFQGGGLRQSWPESLRERRWYAGVPSRNAPHSACAGTSGRPSERGREEVSLVSPCGRDSFRFSMSRHSSSFPDQTGSPNQVAAWLVTLARLSLSSGLKLKQPERSCMQVSRRWGSVRRSIDRGNPEVPRLLLILDADTGQVQRRQPGVDLPGVGPYHPFAEPGVAYAAWGGDRWSWRKGVSGVSAWWSHPDNVEQERGERG